VKALNIPPRRKGRADGTDDPSTLPDLIKAFGAPNPFKVSYTVFAYHTFVYNSAKFHQLDTFKGSLFATATTALTRNRVSMLIGSMRCSH
jgi:hypothetical protein